MRSELHKIDEWVLNLFQKHTIRFLPSAVSSQTGIAIEEVCERLLDWVKMGYLDLEYEIRCPNTGDTLDYRQVLHPSVLLGESIDCDECSEEHSITMDMLFPVFLPNQERKATCQKKAPAVNGMNQLSIGGGSVQSSDAPEKSVVSHNQFSNCSVFIVSGDAKILREVNAHPELREVAESYRELLSNPPKRKEEKLGWIKKAHSLYVHVQTLLAAPVLFNKAWETAISLLQQLERIINANPNM